jgi:flagellar biosynthesis/type III secretory pathway M-ring protein FliF/YscJ
VVVVDSQGVLLSSNSGGNEVAKQANTFLDYKGQMEQYLAKKAEDLLAAALGPGRAKVSVDATIDFDPSSTVKEKSDPEKKIKEETSSTTGGTASKEEKNVVEYSPEAGSKETTTTQKVPGQIKSLTVAAFVDLTPPAKSADNAAPATPVLTIVDVQAIIRNAIGPLATEQNIKVVNTPFYRPPPLSEQAQEESGGKQAYMEYAKQAMPVVLIVGGLLALNLSRKPRSKETALAAATAGAGGGAAVQAAMVGADSMDPQVLRARITRALQENPEEVKRLFMNWAESDKSEV